MKMKDKINKIMTAKVEIDGVTYVPVKGDEDCRHCDIYWRRVPNCYPIPPLCYEYSYHHHKIVDYCAKYRINWKEDKQ